jgi:hypothetical protein
MTNASCLDNLAQNNTAQENPTGDVRPPLFPSHFFAAVSNKKVGIIFLIIFCVFFWFGVSVSFGSIVWAWYERNDAKKQRESGDVVIRSIRRR